MTRHVIDQPCDRSDGQRLRQFAAIDRTSGPEGDHPSARALHRRPRAEDDSHRIEAFSRIERGRRA